jgi:hypothetical protein
MISWLRGSEVHMLDAAFIALTIVFFIAGWAFARACDRL